MTGSFPFLPAIIWGTVIFAGILLALSGNIMSRVAEPKFTVLESEGPFSIRAYAPMIVAEVEVSGERTTALQQGFRLIADYIFGRNTSQAKIAMTAPVSQETGKKIAMTAPVTQQISGETWKVRFVMPSEYSLESLPKPINNQIKLLAIPAKRCAVIRFSGICDNQQLTAQGETLFAYLTKHQLVTASVPTAAYYNPPWTLPFLRRNELLVDLQ